LAAAQAALFNFLVAHAKNISLLHEPGGVRIEMSSIPAGWGAAELSDLAFDFRLNPRAFERERARLASSVPSEAVKLAAQAQAEGWHRPILETIVELIRKRATQL
jgi:hypothetical protein